ncbi:hypothetical protein LTR24_005939 [Lithohypha guttulata]|uniref:BTB domain-containing protein n=1 Tax=Lithohypha guttulata TaxID=1690604 RepID=A0ABR0K7I4_9EURO|nr:hypothetical protein LTR24_005939 [Lithohypha guttulata]
MEESTDIGCVQTQLSDFNGFDAEIYTLKVGPSAKVLRVHGSLLRGIPFFDRIWMDNELPSHESVLLPNLPNLDAQATADVLLFVEKGCVEPFVIRSVRDVPTSARNLHTGPHRYIRAYIAVYQLGVEDIQNALLDILSSFYLDNLIQPEAILLLSKADLRTSKLYSLLMEEMARGAQAGFYNARPLNSSSLLDDLKPDYKATMAQWSSGDFLALTDQIGRLSPKRKRTIAIVAKINPCLFQNHVTTPPCKSLKRKREDEGANPSAKKAQVAESIEDGYSTFQDSPTLKRKRSRYVRTSNSSGEETVAEEQGHVDQDNVQTQACTEPGDYATSAEENVLMEEEVGFRSSMSSSTSPARSQTIQPDSPHVQVASSDIDPSENVLNNEQESDTLQQASRNNPVVSRQKPPPDCSKHICGLASNAADMFPTSNTTGSMLPANQSQ